MENETQKKIESLEVKIDAIYVSVEKTRKYFLMTMIVTLVTFILPLIALIFFIPSFLSSYASALDGSGLGL